MDTNLTNLDFLLRSTVCTELHKALLEKYGKQYYNHPSLPPVLSEVAGKLYIVMGGYLDTNPPAPVAIAAPPPKPKTMGLIRCPHCQTHSTQSLQYKRCMCPNCKKPFMRND